jgi:hypothetical protein
MTANRYITALDACRSDSSNFYTPIKEFIELITNASIKLASTRETRNVLI